MSGGKIAVIIPTTRSLTRVQQIRVDETLHHSVLTVNFRTEAASVSRDYAAFVSRETGVIAKLTGEHQYRTKISSDVERGPSWQLGMLIAHLLKSEDRLAEVASQMRVTSEDDLLGDANEVIWATGEITDDLTTAAVSEVSTKLQLSTNLFEACARNNTPVKVYVPAVVDQNKANIPAVSEQLNVLESKFDNLEVIRLDGVDKDIILGARVASEPLIPQVRADTQKRPLPYLLGGVGALVVLAGALIGLTKSVTPSEPTQPSGTIATTTDGNGSVTIASVLLSGEIQFVEEGVCVGAGAGDRHSAEFSIKAGEQQTVFLPASHTVCRLRWRFDQSPDFETLSLRLRTPEGSVREEQIAIQSGWMTSRNAASQALSDIRFESTTDYFAALQVQPTRISK